MSEKIHPMPISLVVGIAENNIIGANGDMPWRLSTDLKRFKKITLGNPIIMGRKTFQSIGRPLPGRQNIVISRDKKYSHDGVLVFDNLDDAVAAANDWGAANDSGEICIIGGGEIYRQALDHADRLHVTHIDARPDGDTRFPQIDANVWQKIHSEAHPQGEKDSAATQYVIYERK